MREIHEDSEQPPGSQGQGVALLGAPRMQREIPSAVGFFTTSENRHAYSVAGAR